MKYRNPIKQKLEKIESNITNLTNSLNRNNKEECYSLLNKISDHIEQINSYIESEPLSGEELNYI